MEGGGPAQHTGQSRPISAPLSQIMQNDEQVQTTNWNTVLAVGTKMTYCTTVWYEWSFRGSKSRNYDADKNTTILESFSPEIINTIIDF